MVSYDILMLILALLGIGVNVAGIIIQIVSARRK